MYDREQLIEFAIDLFQATPKKDLVIQHLYSRDKQVLIRHAYRYIKKLYASQTFKVNMDKITFLSGRQIKFVDISDSMKLAGYSELNNIFIFVDTYSQKEIEENTRGILHIYDTIFPIKND